MLFIALYGFLSLVGYMASFMLLETFFPCHSVYTALDSMRHDRGEVVHTTFLHQCCSLAMVTRTRPLEKHVPVFQFIISLSLFIACIHIFGLCKTLKSPGGGGGGWSVSFIETSRRGSCQGGKPLKRIIETGIAEDSEIGSCRSVNH